MIKIFADKTHENRYGGMVLDLGAIDFGKTTDRDEFAAKMKACKALVHNMNLMTGHIIKDRFNFGKSYCQTSSSNLSGKAKNRVIFFARVRINYFYTRPPDFKQIEWGPVGSPGNKTDDYQYEFFEMSSALPEKEVVDKTRHVQQEKSAFSVEQINDPLSVEAV